MTVSVVPGSTVKVAQLVGDIDRQTGRATAGRTESRFGVAGTDLGVPVVHDGRLLLYFGDTVPGGRAGKRRERDANSVALLDGDRLDFLTADDGLYLPLQVPGVSLSSYEVPSGAFSTPEGMFVFFTTGRMTRAVVAYSSDGRRFASVSELPPPLVNVAPVVDGDAVWLFWSGAYRESSPGLARMALPIATAPTEVEIVADALFEDPCVGELSAAYERRLGRWLLLYNCTEPRGIVLRSAPTPHGPWSGPEVVFDPWRDGGYCGFIHASWDDRRCDSAHDPGREREWGGEYGAYIIPSLTTGDGAGVTVRFTMSTWNPYTVVLMQAELIGE